MNLSDHYNQLYTNAIHQIAADNYLIDPLIDSPTDKRFGITLLARPDELTNQRIQNVLSALKETEPDQYFYPSSDTHITILSIISCYDGFELKGINIEDYKKIITSCLPAHGTLEIELKGLTASPSCIMIQGFFLSDTLQIIRKNLREAFRNSSLQQSIDKRYTIQTAHSTVVRFRRPLKDKDRFIQTIESVRNFYFGKFTVSELSLVHNDWYQRKEKVTELARFRIPSV